MDERASSRKQLMYYLRAFDAVADRQIGQVVDITAEGFSVVTHRPVEDGRTVPVRLQLPARTGGRRDAEFRAVCRWRRRDAHPEFYRVGFQISCIDDENAALITWLIENYEFSGDEAVDYDLELDLEDTP